MTTSDVGVYDGDLPLGLYTMIAESPGFRPYRRPPSRVMSPTTLTFDIAMPVGKIIYGMRSTDSRSANPGQTEAYDTAFYGEEFFPLPSEEGAPFQLYIRYLRRTATGDRYAYTGGGPLNDGPVFVAYNLFSLQANRVDYDSKTRIIKAEGDVVVANTSGSIQHTTSMAFRIENGQAFPVR